MATQGQGSAIKVDVNFKPSLEAIGQAIGNAELNKELGLIIRDFAFVIERFAKQLTPVDTGRLRASIGTSFMNGGGFGGKAIIAPHTSYAGFVHEGTRYMKARPYMLWGVEYAEKNFTTDINRRLDDKLRQKLSRL